jgi:Fur family ferric uptake transcriptional regulator
MGVESKRGKSTRQRAAIVSAIHDAEAFLSAQELYELLRGRGDRIGLTTVYRNLQSMVERGELDVLRREDGEAVYRRCETEGHHHHLVCRGCGFSVELENEEIERWTRGAASRYRFSEVTHDLELFGICEACSQRAPTDAPETGGPGLTEGGAARYI